MPRSAPDPDTFPAHGPMRPLAIAVLQHVPFEGPAVIGEWLGGRGHTISNRALWRGDDAPAPGECDLLVVMGGPMSVGDTDRYPWLIGEIEAIRACVEAGVPTIGVCLGAQLIAAALGARVYRARSKEIGWWPVEFCGRLDGDDSTRGDPANGDTAGARANTSPAPAASWRRALRRLPVRATVLHWHGDTFDLPDGATRIACTALCPNQGFVYGTATVGLQFHLESTPESAAALATACGGDIERGTWQLDVADPVAAMRRGAIEYAGTPRWVLELLLEHLEAVACSR